MLQWLKKLERKQMAPAATVWMASPSPARAKEKARLTTVNQEILRFVELFFGGLCVFLWSVSLGSWIQELTSWISVLVISIFAAANIFFLHLAFRYAERLHFVLIQPVLGGILCPLAYLFVDGILAPWWPGYAVMCLSGVILVGLATENLNWGRLVVLYYLVGMFLANWGSHQPLPLHHFLVLAGMLAVVGLMLAQIMSILSLSLSKVYERSLKFRQAKEELQELTRLRSDFFANVSHEFRTPITLTLGPLEGILKGRHGVTTPEIRNQIEIVIRNQRRLLGLINQILDAAKTEAGMAELKAARIKDVNRFVEERAEQFRPMALEKGLDLKIILDPLAEGVEIYIDREKFDKIIFNLLSNALKFTDKGSIQIATEIQGGRFQLKVEDTGAGIQQDRLPFIFERFRQAGESPASRQAGSGIGLHLVREFVKLHGGHVAVNSEWGKGTSVRLTIPLGRAHLSSQLIMEEHVDERSEPSSSLSSFGTEPDERIGEFEAIEQEAQSLREENKPTVLFVDDNPNICLYVRELLLPRYNVFLARNGREGLEKAKSVQPDLIISDLIMPVMSGLEFCKALRDDPIMKGIPFVLLTAKAMIESKIEGLEQGADDYLTKPFSEEELLARVGNLIQLRQNQLRLKKELAAAREIQLSLLPETPQSFDGIRVDLLYRPSEELSGDFCDILPWGDWIYLYLADVTSHGTASAQVTYLLKGIFRRAVAQLPAPQIPSLPELMEQVCREYALLHLEYDAGIQVARFHRVEKTLEVVRGNAPSPLRVDRSGGSQVIEVPAGPALTSQMAKPEAPSFSVGRLGLNPGDTVYFFTDGCFEFPAGEKSFGLKRLMNLLRTPLAGDWKESIFEVLAKEHGSPSFPDDLTLLRVLVSP